MTAPHRKPPLRMTGAPDLTPHQRRILVGLHREAKRPTFRLSLGQLAGLLLASSAMGLVAGMALR